MLATRSCSYDVTSPHSSWAETEPRVWQQATGQAVRAVIDSSPGTDVIGVGLAGQMHGAVLVDARGVPTRPAVLWPDSRASAQADSWNTLGQDALASLANPVTPGMAGPILAWLAENEPDVMERSAGFVMPKDWVRSLLAGPPIGTDPSDASATLLWDVTNDGWATELAGATGVPARLLPGIHVSGDSCGETGEGTLGWGVPRDTPVSFGCADVAATLLGLEAGVGRTVITLGTGAQVVLPGVAPKAVYPARHHLYRDASEGWYAMVAVTNAGLAFKRVLDLLRVDWDDLYRPYDRSADLPGFLPFFTGERLPVPLSSSQAGWFDVGLSTQREHLLAAALEGVAFAVRRAVEVMPESDTEIDLAGGGSRSPVFTQLLADVLGRPLRLIRNRDATVQGAARLGWRAAGHEPRAVEVPCGELVEPRPSPELETRYARFVGALSGKA